MMFKNYEQKQNIIITDITTLCRLSIIRIERSTAYHMYAYHTHVGNACDPRTTGFAIWYRGPP